MTLRGYGVLVVAIATGLGSVMFASRYLLTLSAFFFATIGLCYLWSVIHRGKISLTRSTAPEFIYEDTDVTARLSITHSSTQCIIRDYFDDGKKISRFYLPRTTPSAVHHAHYKFHVDRRGIYTLGPVIVRTSDPLGLTAREYTINCESTIRVYPRIEDIDLPRIPLRSSEQSRHMDRNASTTSDDLMGLKEYVMGDDVRLIHWKTSSRTGGLFVRHREKQATLPLILILDCERRSYGSEHEFDAATRLVASVSYASVHSDIPCRLFCNDTGEFVSSHPLIMDRLASSELQQYVQSPADSHRLLSEFDHNYIFITGSHGELFSSAILTIRIVPDGAIQPDSFNMLPLRQSSVCSDFSTRIKQWNAHASLQSLS